MGSERLPNKVMKVVGDDTILGHVINRVVKIKQVSEIMVATTTLPEDQSIFDYCTNRNVKCYRGNSKNVLDRFYRAALATSAEAIMRITADCPVLDPDVSYKVLDLFLRKECDYASNVLPPTYPDGMDTEVFSFETLESAFRSSTNSYQKEHVTPYIYQNPHLFKILNLESEKDLSSFRLVVDTKEDFNFIKKIYEVLGDSFYTVNHKELIKFVTQHSDLKYIKLSSKRNENT